MTDFGSIQKDYIGKAAERLKVRERKLGRPLRAIVVTFGCQMNAKDSEKLRGILSAVGFEEAASEPDADLILYNTCTVRENADQHVYGRLGIVTALKKKNPDLIVGLCGCMMQEEHVVAKIRKSYPVVNLIFGTHNLFTLPELLYRILGDEKRVTDLWDRTDAIVEDLPQVRKYSFKSGVNIMFGCNNFCSYCIVPYVRGRERSREAEEILKEIRSLAGEGVKEIMLLGQNVNSYGNDFGEKELFPKLLKDINDIPGDFLIRFMTSHPKDCSHALIDTMAECEKVEKHLHLPVQSGNSEVLHRMNRHYDREKYLETVAYAREKLPDLSITSDIIVGFPGETHEQFLDTISLIEEVGYSALYTFIYSPRVGTPGARMPDPVSATEKQQWFEELQFAQEQVASKQSATTKGKAFRVLVEGHNKAGRLCGRNSGNTMIEFDGPDDLIGTFQNVVITEPLTWILKGELI